ncbi:MAG: large-conductance mechanosensitive channel protein MscL [Bacteroidetes bacterium]|nr:MAG: large-conductance mechanosensitive channel protein MscL [Bacteroidota bacterium]
MGFIKEFKDFAVKGNVMDLAIAVVIGGAFSAIVKALVDHIIMPLIGVLMGGKDFSGLTYQFGTATVKYGMFIQSVVNFMLIALTLFMVVKMMNKMKKKEEEAPKAPPAPSNEEVLLGEIRDLLKNK